MTTDVTTTQPGGALADPNLVPQNPFGLEDYDGTEFRLPRYSIVQTGQQMTEWNAKGGQFHNSITGENKDELDVVVLAIKQNQWFGPDFDEATSMKAAGKEVQAYCKSSNGKVPDADSPQRQAAACAACPKFKGQRQPDGSFEPPACTRIRKVLFAEDDGTIAMLTVRKGSAAEVDNYAQPFFLRKASPMSVRTKITTTPKKDARNQWYVPSLKARFDQPVSTDEQQHLAELGALYLNFVQHVNEADTVGDEQPANPSSGDVPVTAQVVPDVPEMPKDLPTPEEFGF